MFVSEIRNGSWLTRIAVLAVVAEGVPVGGANTFGIILFPSYKANLSHNYCNFGRVSCDLKVLASKKMYINIWKKLI